MLKREGTLALFVDITLFTGDIIEGGVGLEIGRASCRERVLRLV